MKLAQVYLFRYGLWTSQIIDFLVTVDGHFPAKRSKWRSSYVPVDSSGGFWILKWTFLPKRICLARSSENFISCRLRLGSDCRDHFHNFIELVNFIFLLFAEYSCFDDITLSCWRHTIYFGRISKRKLEYILFFLFKIKASQFWKMISSSPTNILRNRHKYAVEDLEPTNRWHTTLLPAIVDCHGFYCQERFPRGSCRE